MPSRRSWAANAGRAELALAAQLLDTALHLQRYLAGTAPGTAGPVDEPGFAIDPPAGVPLRQALARDPGLGGHVRAGPAGVDP
jgi:hypothetical protein